jgi:hypothetical protein
MGRRPAHGQTPREFAEEVRAALPDAVAAVPAEVTDLYYRARFGGTPPTPEELARADDRLASLAVSLRRR